MRWLRSCYRLSLFVITTVGHYIFLELGTRLSRDATAMRNRIVRRWGRSMCRIAHCQLRVIGAPPKTPFVLVCNHLSYVDILILLSLVDAVPIAKKEVRSWPVMGYICARVGVLFVDRTRRSDVVRMNEQIASQLSKENGLLFFPEGKTSMGAEVLPFKPSLLAFPASQNMPVSYACLTYRTDPDERPAYESVCWWRDDVSFLAHAWRFLQLRKFEADIIFGDSSVVDSDRKKLAQALWQCVNGQFVPVVNKEVL